MKPGDLALVINAVFIKQVTMSVEALVFVLAVDPLHGHGQPTRILLLYEDEKVSTWDDFVKRV